MLLQTFICDLALCATKVELDTSVSGAGTKALLELGWNVIYAPDSYHIEITSAGEAEYREVMHFSPAHALARHEASAPASEE